MVIFENRSAVDVEVHEHRIAEKGHLQAVDGMNIIRAITDAA